MTGGGAGALMCLITGGSDVSHCPSPNSRHLSTNKEYKDISLESAEVPQFLSPPKASFTLTPPSIFHIPFYLGQSSGPVGDTSEFCSET